MHRVRLPELRQFIPLSGQCAELAPFTVRGWPAFLALRTMKVKVVDGFNVRTGCGVPLAGDAGDFPSHRDLRFQYRAGTECIAAVHRQAMIQYVQDASHYRVLLPAKR